MQNIVNITSFSGRLRDVVNKYRHSKEDIEKDIESVIEHPEIGDKYPGFPVDIRKVRLPVKKYKIGKSGGLRLIILRHNGYVCPLLVYYKRQFKESEIVDWIKIALKEFLSEINK